MTHKLNFNQLEAMKMLATLYYTPSTNEAAQAEFFGAVNTHHAATIKSLVEKGLITHNERKSAYWLTDEGKTWAYNWLVVMGHYQPEDLVIDEDEQIDPSEMEMVSESVADNDQIWLETVLGCNNRFYVYDNFNQGRLPVGCLVVSGNEWRYKAGECPHYRGKRWLVGNINGSLSDCSVIEKIRQQVAVYFVPVSKIATPQPVQQQAQALTLKTAKAKLTQALADNGIRFNPRQIDGVILDVFGLPCRHGNISITERNDKIGYTLSWGSGSQTVYSLAEVLRLIGVGDTESPLATDPQRYNEWVDSSLARYAAEDKPICSHIHFADATTMRDVNGAELKVGDMVRWRCNDSEADSYLSGLGVIESPSPRRYEMGAVVKVTTSDSDYWPRSGCLAQPPMDLLKI